MQILTNKLTLSTTSTTDLHAMLMVVGFNKDKPGQPLPEKQQLQVDAISEEIKERADKLFVVVFDIE